MKRDRGFIGLLIILIVALVLAKYLFNWSVFDAAESPQGQETVSYTHQVLTTVWGYISAPIIFVWSKIVWPILAFAGQSFKALIAWGQSIGH
ncbi:hypothetical protein KW785_02985 [Candidatus Parcubacteria bacterium]|nr:hypothetical protein [Candidatus Parcubacteria bacterium]